MASDSQQHYIPISRARVKEKLFQSQDIAEELRPGLAKISQMMEVIWHHSSHARLELLKSLYESMDPDQNENPDSEGKEEFLKTVRE